MVMKLTVYASQTVVNVLKRHVGEMKQGDPVPQLCIRVNISSEHKNACAPVPSAERGTTMVAV